MKSKKISTKKVFEDITRGEEGVGYNLGLHEISHEYQQLANELLADELLAGELMLSDGTNSQQTSDEELFGHRVDEYYDSRD